MLGLPSNSFIYFDRKSKHFLPYSCIIQKIHLYEKKKNQTKFVLSTSV